MAVKSNFLQKVTPFKWWKQHLTTRLSGYFLLLSLVSVSIIVGTTFYRAQASLQKSAFDQLRVAATLKENEINRWFEDQQRIFLAIAQLPIVQSQHLIILNPETSFADREKAHGLLVKYLTSLDTREGIFSEVTILDRSDRVIVSTHLDREGKYESSADLTYFEDVKPGVPTTPIFYTALSSGKLIATFATPLRGSKQEKIGVLIAHLNLDRLGEIVKAQEDLGQSVDAYLVGRVEGANTLVSNTLSKTLAGQKVSSRGIKAAMGGLTGGELYQNYADVSVAGVYHSLSNLGLALLVEQPQAIADLPARQLAHQIMFMGLVLAGSFSLALYYLVRRVMRPVLEIAHTATQVAAGDLEQLTPVLTDDEVGQLARKFNYMIEQLKRSRDQSEIYSHTLEQKAQELQTALQEVSSAQAQLVQSEKMSSLGQLVAGVAHEINNPVNFIHGNLKHVQDYTQDLLSFVKLYQKHYPNPIAEVQAKAEEIDLPFLQQDLDKTLASMKIGTDRIRQIVLSLRNFSRMDEAAFKAVDIHEGIDSTLMILQHRLKALPERPAIELIQDYANLPLVECYPGQLNQVLMNLLANAIDALEQADAKRTLQDIKENPSQITIRTGMIDHQWVEIAISDNGPGISENVKARIFDPFFTTKPIGKGTGMGLSISYQIIVEKHGGRLECFSNPNQGTTFGIQIPIQQQAFRTV